MKQLVKTYALNGAQIILTGVDVPLNQILLVANATTGFIHYSVSGPAPTAYTKAEDSVITLATAPTAGDKLTIYFDDGLPNSASSASITNFSSIGASAQILASNTNRKSLILANDVNGSSVYILFGSGVASSSNYSIRLDAGDTATITGVILALQGNCTGAGDLHVTELT
jgi:hypothetical protein